MLHVPSALEGKEGPKVQDYTVSLRPAGTTRDPGFCCYFCLFVLNPKHGWGDGLGGKMLALTTRPEFGFLTPT